MSGVIVRRLRTAPGEYELTCRSYIGITSVIVRSDLRNGQTAVKTAPTSPNGSCLIMFQDLVTSRKTLKTFVLVTFPRRNHLYPRQHVLLLPQKVVWTYLAMAGHLPHINTDPFYNDSVNDMTHTRGQSGAYKRPRYSLKNVYSTCIPSYSPSQRFLSPMAPVQFLA